MEWTVKKRKIVLKMAIEKKGNTETKLHKGAHTLHVLQAHKQSIVTILINHTIR